MDNKTVTSEVAELTEEDLAICKKVIPPSQYNFTLELTQGEEGEFFKNKLKEIADTYRRINVDEELVNEDGTHNVGFRYFLGSTEIFLSEIDSDGIGFGYYNSAVDFPNYVVNTGLFRIMNNVFISQYIILTFLNN